MLTVLVTGAAGFIGRHLSAHLLRRPGVRVVGLTRREPPADAGGVEWRQIDLLDPASLAAVVREVRPDRVFHLAGMANPNRAKENPDQARADNVTATENLYAALAGTPVQVLFAGTGHVYAPAEVVTEQNPVVPNGPYAESKAAADAVSGDAGRRFGLPVVLARLFNSIGPGQETGYAVPDWASQIVAAERRGEPLTLTPRGNLADRKDLSDVRDVVVAIDLLQERGQAGQVYNVASGESRMMGDVLDRLAAQAKVPVTWPRPAASGPPLTVDVSKLHATTGWRPAMPLDRTLADVLDFWRSRS